MDFFVKNLWGEDIPSLAGLRDKGKISFAEQGFPTIKTEAWKYSYFQPEDLGILQADVSEHICGEDCHCHEKQDLPFDAYRLKICNGNVSGHHFDFPEGIFVKSLAEAIYDGDVKNYLNKSFDMNLFPFAALNTAYLEQGLFVCVERGFCADKPIYLNYHNHAEKNIFCNIRNIFVVESDANIVLIEDFNSEKDGQYFCNTVNEIYIGRNAHFRHYKKQNESAKAHHIALNCVNVKQNGTYTSFCHQNECIFARNETYVKLLEEGAEAKVDAVYKLQNNGHSDITTNIRHLAEHTVSNQLVKGVLSGNSKGVFQGQIHIAPDAQKTQGYQLHQALLLSDDAVVDCKPELEIFADDVKCSHGATSGDLDKNQLFYMQSRGIPYDEAKQILIDAYLNEVYSHIADDEIRQWIQKK